MRRRIIILMVSILALAYAAFVAAQHEHMDKGQMQHEETKEQEKITLII